MLTRSVVSRLHVSARSDPRPALRALSIPITTTQLWRWPFAPDVDYLACATLTGPAHACPGGPSFVL